MDSKTIRSAVFLGCTMAGAVMALPIQGHCVENPNQINPSALTNEVTIKQWQLIGPFKFAQNDISADNPHAVQGGLNRDFLSDLGYPEEKLSPDAINSICTDSKLCRAYTQHGADLLFDHLFPGMTYAVIYATAEITSTEDEDVGFELGSDDGAKVWLNGQLLLATRNDVDRAAFKYTHLLTVHLKKGVNFLVIKIDQKRDTWALITSFMSLEQLHLMAIEQANGHLLSSRILKSGEPLHLLLPVLPVNLAVHFEVISLEGSSVMSSDYTASEAIDVKLPQLAEGYYSVQVHIGTKELQDSFYLGDPSKVFDEISRVQQKMEPTSQEYIQREPLIQRYRILNSDQYSHPLNPDWQKKVVMVTKEGLQTLHYPTEALWSKLPGMHLREYISKVDGTTQNYLLFLPEGVKGQLPLVLVTPFALKPVRPFLESAHIAWPEDLEDIQNAANMSGVAVAITYGRGNIGDAPIGEADEFEVLNDINNNYSIDWQRLYLYGTCEGGRRALLLAEHYPGVFAVIGLYGPTLTAYSRNRNGGYDDPFALTDQLSSTPVFLVKGEYDDSPPTAELEALNEKLKRSESPSQIDIIPDGMHKQKRVEQLIFPFLVRYKNDRNPVLIVDQYEKALSRAHP